ncbi:PD-(D/E)XK nuclease family protein [Aeropyrum pernix]|nr:DUF3782 domain-containing protein [Aeropyrum pernix]
MSSLSKREIEKILRTLERDREFRYALMGLLGFKELLERFEKLEERQLRLEERFSQLEERQIKLEERFQLLEKRFQRLEERHLRLERRFQKLDERFQRLEQRQLRLEERFQRLEQRFQSLEERYLRLEQRFQRLEERFRLLEERFQKLEQRQLHLEERFQRLEERQLKLEQRFQKLEERHLKLEQRFQRLEEEFRRLSERVLRVEQALVNMMRMMNTIAHRFGILTEEAFRSAMKHVVEEVLGAGVVGRWIHHDKEGIVYGHPSIVEVDVVVKDGQHVLVEIKSQVTQADVAEMHRIGLLYERAEGVKPRLVIVGGFVDERARALAERLGVEIAPITPQ